jgi:hypothetical protein
LFQYKRKSYPYLEHEYNYTRYNERAVEVPVGLSYLIGHEADTLEIGAVLPHYLDWDTCKRHTVVDLHEVYPGVINEDVLTYEPGRTFKRVIAISTLEHLAHRDLFLTAVERLKSWVAPKGILYITAPAGWHESTWLTHSCLRLTGLDIHRFDKTKPASHEWTEVTPWDHHLPRRYGVPMRWANTVYLMEYRA